jgi:hypothetical protein
VRPGKDFSRIVELARKAGLKWGGYFYPPSVGRKECNDFQQQSTRSKYIEEADKFQEDINKLCKRPCGSKALIPSKGQNCLC